MNSVVVSLLLIAAAYLIGAIPFGYLFARWVKGIDIRTVGSGNIGATNVGRVLGFRYFWPVFLFDLLKGFVPTWGFPLLADRLTGGSPRPDLAVLVALATILGHNFPVYLRFRGGKGVATSLGAVFALDPLAGTFAAFGFLTLLLITGYVSFSSIGGGIAFFLVHFSRVAAPWSRKELAMSLLTIALLALLIGRHRKNLSRIASRTEPKVSLRRKKKPPTGSLAVRGLFALAFVSSIVAVGMVVTARASRRETLVANRFTMTEVDREATGHQRAERIAFADAGRLLAVTCPRYCRLVLYRVTDRDSLELLDDLELDGKPVAVSAASDRLYVLERPEGDNRHIHPGWMETIDFQGRKVGEKTIVGYYPDDLALSPDGRHAYVVSSGRAEGDSNKPAPELVVHDLKDGSKAVGRVSFEGPDDDPARITLSASGRCAAVTLLGANKSAALDLSDPERPREIGRASLALSDRPYVSRSDDDALVMPAASGREALALSIAGVGDCVASSLPRDSGVEIVHVTTAPVRYFSLGRLTLHGGALGLSSTRPTGLAYSAERNLLAVANRSGGVHLLTIRPNSETVVALPETDRKLR